MTRDGISKKQRQADQRHKKRMQAAAVWLTADKAPPRPVQRSRPSAGRATAMSEPLPPMHYPVKRVGVGKRQGGSPA